MWIELDLYAGRPNPGWTLTADEASALSTRLATLPPATDPARREDEPLLGYRGLRFADPDGGTTVSLGAGVAARTDHAGRMVERWRDPDRALERWLLDSARGRLDDALHRIALAGPHSTGD